MLPLLLDVSLKASLLLAATWPVRLVLRRRPAAVRHLIWTASACGLLLLPLLAACLPAWRVAVPSAVLPSGLVYRSQAAATAPSAGEAAQPASPPAGQAAPRAAFADIQPAGVVLLVWGAGVAFCLLRLLFGMAAARRLAGGAAEDGAITALAIALARESGLGRPPRVLLTPSPLMPVTFGMLHPLVLLPAASRDWSAERLRLVLLHEMAHIRRQDCFTQMLMRLAVSLYWFHPLAWIALREFLRERERASDDLVLGRGALPSSYAHHLLEIARSMNPPAGACATVAMARPSQIEGRLLAILKPDVPRGSVGWGGIAIAGALVAALVLPLAAMRPAAAAQVGAATTPNAQVLFRGQDLSELEKLSAGLCEQGQAAEAEPLLRQALAMRAARFGEQSPEYADGLVKLARFYGSCGRKDAQPYWRQALAIREAALGPEHPDLVEPLLELAIAAHGRDPAAESLYQRALAIGTRAFGAGDPRLAPILTDLALLYQQQRRTADAEPMYTRAIAAAKPDSPERATALELYARLLRDQQHSTEARLAEDQAAQIRKLGFAQTADVPAARTYRVKDGVKRPALLHKVEPGYTAEARLAKHQGTAVLSVEIGLDGRAHNVQLLRGVGLGLDEKAAQALRQWVFRPGTRDGQPVVVAATVEVNFRLY
ncbi:MAG TPA: TonB family protein [Bryobacteraceae bacterium]|nr:TonB family protein [Bryobacteraceae bacterium]